MSPKNKTTSLFLWTEIDLSALKNNFRLVRRSLKNPSVGVLAIVKDDAYGHGMIPVARALWGEGARFFGVANIDEAIVLRKALPGARILTLGCFHPSQLQDYILKKITPTISCLEDLSYLVHALKNRRGFPVHVKIDTGMGRLGLPYRETANFFSVTKNIPQIEIEGVYTHFSSADDESADPTRRQLTIFSDCLKAIHAAGFKPRYIHASNSMGTLRFKQAHFNLVRPGLVLYGLKPGAWAKLPAGIKPVLSWKTRISFLKPFSAGQTVSYGRTHRISADTVIGALPVGYSHGYRVAFSNRAQVLVGGKRCPVAGRVTMDQALVDLGPGTRARRWEEAVLIGQQKGARVTAEELALAAGTIPYEIICAIHPRVKRVYR